MTLRTDGRKGEPIPPASLAQVLDGPRLRLPGRDTSCSPDRSTRPSTPVTRAGCGGSRPTCSGPRIGRGVSPRRSTSSPRSSRQVPGTVVRSATPVSPANGSGPAGPSKVNPAARSIAPQRHGLCSAPLPRGSATRRRRWAPRGRRQARIRCRRTGRARNPSSGRTAELVRSSVTAHCPAPVSSIAETARRGCGPAVLRQPGSAAARQAVRWRP
jgi:hypothetical protein